MKHSRKLIIWIISIVVVIAFIVSAFAIPAAMSDGTGNYTGAQLEAAQFVLDHDRSQTDVPVKIIKAQVESVVASPQGTGSTGKPLRCTDDPQDKDYYTVTIKHVWLFGITYDTREYNICRLFGWPR